MADCRSVTARILDGKATATAIKAELKSRIAALRERGIELGLGTILVGDDPGSRVYVRGKHRDSLEVGIKSIEVELPASASQADVEAEVERLNADPECTGFIVQTPLPAGIDESAMLASVDPAKDVDGLHPVNLGWLVHRRPAPQPCTQRGVVELLQRYSVPLDGAEVCVVGRGLNSARVLALILTQRTVNATVTVCHTRTKDLAAHTRTSDIVITAAGLPGLLTPDMVRPGAAVVDVGITRTEAGLVGDVDPAVEAVAGWLSPVPGGVGPMTRAMLLANVVEAAERTLPE